MAQTSGDVCCKTDTGCLIFWCPGCNTHHGPRVDGSAGWKWNGSFTKPTVTPSILVRGTVPVTDDEADRIMAGEKIEPKPTVCHSYMIDGQIQFLTDCTHRLAGQIVPMKPFDNA